MIARRIAGPVCAFLLAGGAVFALSQAKPVNAKCPVKPQNAPKPEITALYKGRTVGFCCESCKQRFAGDPGAYAEKISEISEAPPKADTPINAKCPVRPDQPSKAAITVTVQGKVIGFCCKSCLAKFSKSPEAYLASIPELRSRSGSSAEKTGPCEVTRTAKGYYCTTCTRELGPDDVRGSLCKRCESKPAEIEYCVKLVPKPVPPRNGKPQPPQIVEDRARIAYECSTCGARADLQADVKHKPDCKPVLGATYKKICSKSGKPPHVGDER
ncbi:MAG: hypothetical protein ACK44W_05030 [Planctomycetota bacterium]